MIMRIFRLRLRPVFFPLAMLVLPAAEAAAQCSVASIQFENDIGVGGTDRHYTHGSRLSCISDVRPSESSLRRLSKSIEIDVFGVKFLRAGPDTRYAAALGQSMFTPEDLTRTDLIRDDRPYAGWLFGSFGLVLGPHDEQKVGSVAFDRIETLQLTLGMVGPASASDRTQKFVHSVINAQKPRGWRNQLKNEPGFILEYESKARWEAFNFFGLEADLMPSAGFALGNIHTYASTAMTFRFGSRLANDFGPPRIRPSIAGSEFYDPSDDERLGAYFFVSLGGRAVARNIFLDGYTFRSSHSVDREIWVGDVQLGAVVSLWGRARLSFTHIFRSREFEQQDSINQFSAISLSFLF